MSGPGRSSRLLTRAALLPVLWTVLWPVTVPARTQNFATGSPFGMGIVAGGFERPRSGYVSGGISSSTNYSGFFSFEPFFDLGNVQLRARAGWTFYPLMNGASTDANGVFTESSSAGSFDYGVLIHLAPVIGKKLDRRLYISVGIGSSIVRLRNARKYGSGSMAGLTNTETVQGTALEISGGLGYEFFLLQNYSLQIEGGYMSRSAKSFKYRSSTDTGGAAKSDGAAALDAAGNGKGFHVYSGYALIGLNLNL